MKTAFDFSGKKYLVTGASSGLGRDISVLLSKSGAQLVVTGRNAKELDATLEMMSAFGHIGIAYDFSTEEDFTELFERAVADGHKLDGFVHSAGLMPLTPVNTLKKKTINDCLSVNLVSFLELMRCFSKKKYRTEKTSVVGISSICSLYPGKCQTVYAASKAAMNTAVQALALELYSKCIRVNSVLPGTIRTKGYEDNAILVGKDTQAENIKKQIHGLISTEEVFNVVAFLLSDASSAITGRALFADGGYIN